MKSLHHPTPCFSVTCSTTRTDACDRHQSEPGVNLTSHRPEWSGSLKHNFVRSTQRFTSMTQPLFPTTTGSHWAISRS